MNSDHPPRSPSSADNVTPYTFRDGHRVVACPTVQYQQRPQFPYTSRNVTTCPAAIGSPSTSRTGTPLVPTATSSTLPTLTCPGMIGYGTPASWPLAR